MKKRGFIVVFFALAALLCQSQTMERELIVRKALSENGQAKILVAASRDWLDVLSNTVSVDAFRSGKWLCYVNEKGFDKFLTLNLPYEPLIENRQSKASWVATDTSQMLSWNLYPSYEVYVALMQGFAEKYPDLCRLDTIGATTNGRLLLVLCLSDSVNHPLDKPKCFFSSSMHGDELTGAVMMLRLADYMLANAHSDARISQIMSGIRLYICPMANPDGTYCGGNQSVSVSKRFNANNVDLNRNFPSPKLGLHPDEEAFQAETMAFMEYAIKERFDINYNLHGGSEVCNYPYDYPLPSNGVSHPDNDWFVQMCGRFVDTLRQYAPPNYFTDVASCGYILGYDWYPISGSRQDYHTYSLGQRETTLEISINKTPPPDSLPSFWHYLNSGFLTLMEECFYGVNGKVKDSLTGAELDSVMVFVDYHDDQTSFVYSKTGGYYFRPLHQGSYSLTFSKQGYVSRTFNVNLADREQKTLNVSLVSGVGLSDVEERNEVLNIFPNPCLSQFEVVSSSNGSYQILNLESKRLMEGKIAAGRNIIDTKGRIADGKYLFAFIESKSGKPIVKTIIIINR